MDAVHEHRYMEAADHTAASLGLDEAQHKNLESFYFTDLQLTDRFRRGAAENTGTTVEDIKLNENQAVYRYWLLGEYFRKNPEAAEKLKTPKQTYQLMNELTLGDDPLLKANSLATGEASTLMEDFDTQGIQYTQNLLGLEADGVIGAQTTTAMSNYFRLFNKMPREMIVDKYEQTLKYLEGDVHHTDTVDRLTSPYGVEKTTHKQRISDYAQMNNKKVSELTKKDYLKLSRGIFGEMHQDITNSQPLFKKLTKKQQFAVTSAKYNTGTTYSGWIKAFHKHNQAPSVATLSEVIKQSRRKETPEGKAPRYTKGLDNRAVRELRESGVVDPNNVVHQRLLTKYLDKWDSKTL